MMKKIFTMAALAFLMTACSNDIDEPQAQQQPANSDGMITITAKLAPKSEAGTRAVAPGTDSNGKDIIKVKWAVDEHLAILYEVNSTKYEADARISYVDANTGIATITFSVVEGTADNTACTIVYPKSAAKEDHSGVKDAATLLATQDGTLNANLDVRVGAGTIIATTPNLIVTTQPAAQFAIVKFSLTDGANDIAATQFVIKDGSDNVLTTVTPFPASSELYVAMAPATASTFRFEATTSTSFYTYAKLSATLAAGTYYHSPLALTITRMQHNPLWWVAQYNMAEGGSSFVTSHSTESQYCFDWAGACAEDVANYHLPTIDELESIFPCDGKTNIFSLSETLASPKEFSEIACTVGGNSVSANTSVIGKNADADYYADLVASIQKGKNAMSSTNQDEIDKVVKILRRDIEIFRIMVTGIDSLTELLPADATIQVFSIDGKAMGNRLDSLQKNRTYILRIQAYGTWLSRKVVK